MSPENLKAFLEQQLSIWINVSSHRMVSGEEVCRVTLPLWEPNGDVISVYVSENGQGLVVHDGGHILGFLFESRRNGPTSQDRDVTERLLSDSGLTQDPHTGVVNATTTEDGLWYWLMELGRVMALLPALVPTNATSQTRASSSRMRGRTARALRNRLVHEGYGKAIMPPRRVRGLTNRSHGVALSYTTGLPFLRMNRSSTSKTVHVLAVDLDVARPLVKADRSIGVANDLLGSNDDSTEIDVRMVYSFGKQDGDKEPAARLLAVTGERSSIKSFSWDAEEEQSNFLALVGQELAISSA